MTSKEFVIWLKGFTEGVHEYNVTPKQWELLKSKLEEVNDHPYSISVGTGGYGTINTSTTFTTGSGAWHYTSTNMGIKDFSPSDELNVGGQTITQNLDNNE